MKNNAIKNNETIPFLIYAPLNMLYNNLKSKILRREEAELARNRIAVKDEYQVAEIAAVILTALDAERCFTYG